MWEVIAQHLGAFLLGLIIGLAMASRYRIVRVSDTPSHHHQEDRMTKPQDPQPQQPPPDETDDQRKAREEAERQQREAEQTEQDQEQKGSRQS